MLIQNFLVICTTLLVVVTCISKTTVSVDNGKTVTLTWTVKASLIEVHVDGVIFAFISGGQVTLSAAAKSKFGSRFKVEKVGSKLTVTIEDVKHSDEGDYDALERPGGGTSFISAGIKTLNVKDITPPNNSSSRSGLTSSDTGLIVGIVVGVFVIICICIGIFCYRKKKRASKRNEESAVPMNEQTSSAVEKYEPQSKHDEKVIYSELGPGGRQGPRQVVAKSEYASAKDI